MPAFGFGVVGGNSTDERTAGYPTSGLVALYKCDEMEGAVLKDATGNLPDIALATGVALDCTTNAQYIVDTTEFATNATTGLNGQAATLSFGFSIFTPAETGGTPIANLIGGDEANPAVSIYIQEAVYGAGRRWAIKTSIRCTLDGGAAASYALTMPTTFLALESSKYYEVVGLITTDSASGPSITVAVRTAGGNWSSFQRYSGSAGTYVFSSTQPVQILAQDETAAFTGKVQNIFVSHGALDFELMKNLLKRPSPTYIQSALGARARYWSFCQGSGTKAFERVTGTVEEIAGTETFATGLTGCTQYCLRQGNMYYGKAGVRIGGEAGFTPQGSRSVSPGVPYGVLTSADGWTVLATMKVGANDPTAEMVLCGFHGPDDAGNISTLTTDIAGVHFTIGTDQVLKARIKKMKAGDDSTQDGDVADIGVGANHPDNGLLTTYAISCSSAGAITLRRVSVEDTSVTTVTHAIGTDVAYRSLRANAAGIGWASMDADAVIGFLAGYQRALTDAEIMQCHKMAAARMRGQDIYVNGATGLLGNGSEIAPYSTIQDAWRTMQPGQTVRVAGGTYGRLTNLGTTAGPSTSDRITVIGTGSPVIMSTNVDSSKYPLELTSGHFTFSGITFDAADDANNITTPEALPGYSNAVNCNEDVEYVSFANCAFNGAAKSEESNGTGFACRAKVCIITDCTGADNEEHVAYLRRWVGETEDGSVTVDGLTCTIPAGAEDGLKITAEGAGGRLWRGSIRNLTVTGGKNQLNLKGFVGDVANVLLVDQESEQELLAACYLGTDPAYTGETLDSDYRFEGRVTNMTIVGANARAVWVKGSNTTAELYNVLTEGTAGVDLEVDEDSTCTTSHCAGDAATGEWPDENGNIPGATITFTNAAGGDYTLVEASDGYGDGVNMTGIIEEAEADLAGDDRPTTGAWNIGAY